MPNIDEDGSKKEKSRSVRERNLGWGVKERERERERERDCALSNQLTMCGFYGFHNIYNYVIQNYNSFFFL